MPIEAVYVLGAIVAILIAAFVVLLIVQYNKLSKLKATVKESYSTLEVFLEKRLEIVLKLLDLCSEEALKDREIGNLLSVVTQLKQTLQTQRRFKLESNLDNAIQTALSSLAKYNKSNAEYQQLLLNLNSIQSDIISTKNYYNNNVEQFNKKLNKFPSNITARMFGFKKEYYLK